MREKKGWKEGRFICQRSGRGNESRIRARHAKKEEEGKIRWPERNRRRDERGRAIKIDMFEEPGFFGQSNYVCVFAAR